MILLDTSGLLAAIDSSQRTHSQAASALASASPPRLLSPFVLAELDYLLATRVGEHAEHALLTEVAAGSYRLEPFGADGVAAALAVMQQYADLHVGLADASVVVLGVRHGCLDVLTLDERHFRTLRGPNGQQFRVLPADSPA
jgi:predicted nucleic acid-binding protein